MPDPPPHLQFTITIVKFTISAMEDEDDKFLCSLGIHTQVTRRYMASDDINFTINNLQFVAYNLRN